MLTGEPFVAARSESDYWSYSRFLGSTCFCATTEGELIAVLIAFRDQSQIENVYIQDILVDTAFRKQGVTRMLLENLVKAAVELGCSRIWLTSETGNDATNVWLKLGFQNLPADYQQDHIHVHRNFKGAGKDRAIFEVSF